MRILGEITSKHTGVVEIECDICGRRGNPYQQWDIDSSGYATVYSTVTIETERVTSMPGDRYGTKRYFDICDECFDKIVLPALEKTIGKKIHEEYFG